MAKALDTQAERCICLNSYTFVSEELHNFNLCIKKNRVLLIDSDVTDIICT